MSETKETVVQNKMGIIPISKLLPRMAAPMMLSMIISALYNVVDSLFVSRIPDTDTIINAGDKAVNALTLAFPVQMLILALCLGTGVGVSAALSHSLGVKDEKKVSRIAGNAILLSVIYYIIILLFALFGTRTYLTSQTSDSVILEYGCSYLGIVTLFSFGNIFYICFEKLLQATGKSMETMLAQIAGALTNIILDPVFIFGLAGVPAMGVTGAAIATVIGQTVSLVVSIIFHFTRNKEIKNNFAMFKLDAAIIRRIYAVGAPTIVMLSLTSVMTYGMNIILGAISDAAVTAYGVYYKLQNFIFMPAFGLNNASIPIISYNHGAAQKKRVKETIRCAIVLVTIIMGIGILLLQCFAGRIVGLFSLSGEAARLCVLALRIITFGFLFAGVNIILQGTCQALGNGVYSLMISFVRLVLVVLPLAWALSKLEGGLDFVWIAFPAAECAGLVIAVLLSVHIYRQKVLPMKETDVMEDGLPSETLDTGEMVIWPSRKGIIITISREHGTAGKQIGKAIAEKLDIPFYYKELTALAAHESGLDREFVSNINKNSPAFLRELYLSNTVVQEAVIAQEKIIRKIADCGSCVIVGRAADYVLRDYENVLRIFLYAPRNYRVEKVMEMYGDTAREAAQNITRSDNARAAYYKNISGLDWGDVHNYELCVDCSAGVDEVSDMVVEYVRRRKN